MSETQIDNQLITDLARDLIAQVAPQEGPLFLPNSKAYFKDPQKALLPQAGKDEMLGFGDGGVITFLTPVALMVTTEVVKFLTEEVKKSATAEGAGIISEAVKSLFKKFRPKNNKVPPLTLEQLAQVKKLATKKAVQLKLSESKAALLADSIVASLATQ